MPTGEDAIAGVVSVKVKVSPLRSAGWGGGEGGVGGSVGAVGVARCDGESGLGDGERFQGCSDVVVGEVGSGGEGHDWVGALLLR